MKAREIRDLIDFISHSGLDEVNIETEEFKLSVKKNSWAKHEDADAHPVPHTGKAPHSKTQSGNSAPYNSSEEPVNPEIVVRGNNTLIKSPMIGTFYRASSPDAEPFIKVGDIIEKGQTVCIIEAMKLFNEIESEVSGKVLKVLAENASPVEFDQPLFLIEPS